MIQRKDGYIRDSKGQGREEVEMTDVGWSGGMVVDSGLW